jgi:hypothetical protein
MPAIWAGGLRTRPRRRPRGSSSVLALKSEPDGRESGPRRLDGRPDSKIRSFGSVVIAAGEEVLEFGGREADEVVEVKFRRGQGDQDLGREARDLLEPGGCFVFCSVIVIVIVGVFLSCVCVSPRVWTLAGPWRDLRGTLAGPWRDPGPFDSGCLAVRSGTLAGPLRDPSGTLAGPWRDSGGTSAGPVGAW